jgi:hypothetical protein
MSGLAQLSGRARLWRTSGAGGCGRGKTKGRQPRADAPHKLKERRQYSDMTPLLGAAAEQVQDHAGGDPVIVLVKARAESRAIVIDVD